MKSIALLTLIAVSAAIVTPEAKADKETRALIGGLVGGLIIGTALADDDSRSHVSVGYSRSHRSHGHWEWISVKKWVPGHRTIRYDRCGTRYKTWTPGYYTYVRKKVWVERDYRGGYGHRDYRRHHRSDYYDDCDDDRRERRYKRAYAHRY